MANRIFYLGDEYPDTTIGGGGGASAIADLTDVELTSLTDGQILKYDSTSQKWVNANESGGVNYSTTEQVIGTWIDGKTLYQKSIEIQSVPSNSWDTFSYGISEAVTVRDYKCMIFNGNVCMNCDHNRPDTVNSEFYCVADKAGFFIRTFNNNYSGSSAVVTIYYTKDND